MDVFYLRSFWDLNSTRRFEFGPIPWDAIVKYGYHVGLDADIIDSFAAIIRAMDASFVDWVKSSVKREREQKQTANTAQTVDRQRKTRKQL